MALGMPQSLASAMEALRRGGPVLLRDDDDREGEADMAFAAAHCTPSLINFTLSNARGLLCVAIEEERAARLGIQRLRANGLDPHGTPFGFPVTISDGTSGVSASSRAATILRIASDDATPRDFCQPGHVATLIARPGGVLERAGHTEAIIDLLRCAGIAGPGVLCEVLSPSGEIAKGPEIEHMADQQGFPILTIRTLIEYLATEREAAA